MPAIVPPGTSVSENTSEFGVCAITGGASTSVLMLRSGASATADADASRPATSSTHAPPPNELPNVTVTLVAPAAVGPYQISVPPASTVARAFADASFVPRLSVTLATAPTSLYEFTPTISK